MGSQVGSGEFCEINLIFLQELTRFTCSAFFGAPIEMPPLCLEARLVNFLAGVFDVSLLVGDFLSFLSGGHLANFLATVLLAGFLEVALFEDFLFERISLLIIGFGMNG